jgi:acyl-CoA thioester hydrolase
MSDLVGFDTPIIAPEFRIDSLWLDEVGYLKSAAYVELFERIAETGLEILGCGKAYRARTGHAMAPMECHGVYLRRLYQGAQVRGTFRLLDSDDGRIHVYQELFHVEGWLAAAMEHIYAHVDLADGAIVSFSNGLASDVSTMLRYHRSLPRPKYIARTLSAR